MSKVYNQVGSLTTIKTTLQHHGIHDFKSVHDIISFLNGFSANRQNIISNSSLRIDQEINKLKEEIPLLEDFIEISRDEYTNNLLTEIDALKQQLNALSSSSINLFGKLNAYLKGHKIQSKIRYTENNFNSIISSSLRRHTDSLTEMKRRLKFIDNNFEKAVQEYSYTELQEIDRKKKIVDELKPFIYGAIGEHKVSNELARLPDDCILINDFSCSFHPPIYNKRENDYIKSVQIDHILVAPSGVYLIETKNWSEQSINNLSLRSPIDQIKRTSFALYIALNSKQAYSLLQHHWGERKIPIKNLIVMINQKPIEEFQHVKILTLKELCSYIEYFKPIFSLHETQTIGNYLLRLSGNFNYE